MRINSECCLVFLCVLDMEDSRKGDTQKSCWFTEWKKGRRCRRPVAIFQKSQTCHLSSFTRPDLTFSSTQWTKDCFEDLFRVEITSAERISRPISSFSEFICPSISSQKDRRRSRTQRKDLRKFSSLSYKDSETSTSEETWANRPSREYIEDINIGIRTIALDAIEVDCRMIRSNENIA